MIPLCKPDIGAEEIAAVQEVLESGWLMHGPKVKAFEEQFAAYVGVSHAIAMNSCASALLLALLAQDLHGEVLVPSFTYVASVNAIVNAGCLPVFVDIDYETCNIDVGRIEEKMTSRTVAIMPVHYGGQSCRMDEIERLAQRYGAALIEDSAEAIGATFQGRPTGSFGVGCFSFFPSKNLTSGEGGMLTTNDDNLAERVRTFIGHGISKQTWVRRQWQRPWQRAAILPGYNFRMTDMQGALGVVQLNKLERMNDARRSHAHYLNEHLAGLDGISIPTEQPDCKHVYQMYTVKVDPTQIKRDEFVFALRDCGIEASVHFDPPVHQQPYYVSFAASRAALPVTEFVARTIVTLPMFPQLTKIQLDQIVERVIEAAKRARV